tara:strand:- start:973 stop:2619 length:1647 start_codon:yes stop_codon:yes gene_type:complete
MKIAILGGFSTQFLTRSLKQVNKNLNIYESEFSQIDIEILNEKSKLYDFKPDFLIIHETSISFKRNFYKRKNNHDKYSKKCIERLHLLIEKVHSIIPKVKILYPSLDFENEMNYGNFYSKIPQSIDFQLKEYNHEVLKTSLKYQNFFILDINHLIFNNGNVRDHKLVITSDLHFSLEFTKLIAKSINKIICSAFGEFKKCVIVDLDNTLWGGTIGDDGLEGIQIGELGIGKAFSEFQIWLKSLKERGVILCVCSKNDEKIAKNPFINHPEMILKLDDIAIFVANWNNKFENISYIQKVLNIGFDSMVFIDDNVFERELVKSANNEIVVPNLPKDPTLFKSYLIELNLFEITNYSDLDNKRTTKYQAEDRRRKLKASSFDLNTYLISLKMQSKIELVDKSKLPRVVQLIQRTNQFNARTIRYNDFEIQNILEDKNYFIFCFNLQDKFGSHGLVSLVILKKIDLETVFVDTFIMSCRVFNRGLEYFIFDQIKLLLKKKRFKKICVEWIPTKKNNLIKECYQSLGFQSFKDRSACLEFDKLANKNYYIDQL